MHWTRRRFLAMAAGAPLLSLVRHGEANAPFSSFENAWALAPTGNLYLGFNSLAEGTEGESDEFSTPLSAQETMRDLGVPDGATVIALGARTGTPTDPFGQPGEMALHWHLGDAWDGKVTDPIDSSPVPWGEHDPVPFMMVGVLNEATAHRFVLDDPMLEGSVLWNLHQDKRQVPLVEIGFHNAFSDKDDGLADALFTSAQDAKRRPQRWATAEWRETLTRFMPSLAGDWMWQRFVATYHDGLLLRNWLPFIRDQGWQGVAVVLRGRFMNVAQFHQQEWHYRKPGEVPFDLLRGTDRPLGLRFKAEYRSFIETDAAEWTMMGFIWDSLNPGADPDIEFWRESADAFGHDFHIHGFREDGSRLGHTLFAVAGGGPLEVSLYPLEFSFNRGAFLFNNDLRLLPSTLSQTPSGLRITVKNDGVNFARNVQARLSGGLFVEDEIVDVPLVLPRESVAIEFTGRLGRSQGPFSRVITLDSEKRFLEGGSGRRNNRLLIDSRLRWRWLTY